MNRGLSQPWLFWAGCLMLVLLASLFGRPDIPIDETRYLGVAWEMWSGGDWLVLHRNGIPYHHKPPLLFWLIGLGWGVFGVNDWWPRGISAFASLICTGLTAAIARRLWPRETGVGERAGWLLLGSTFWLFFSTSVIFDVLLTVFVLLALLAALRVWQGGGRSNWALFGVAIGLGVLAKGPVVLLHVLPPVLLAPWWAGRRPRAGEWYKGIGLGVLLGAAIALAWAVPAAIAGGEEFRNAIFWGQTAGRVSGSLAHKQPFWFYLAVLPLLLFPWVLRWEAWRAAIAAVREGGGDAGVRFTLAWMLPAFIGFSLAGGKQVHYLLPILPAFALILAYGWAKAPTGQRGAGLPLFLAIAALGGALLASPRWTGGLWLGSMVDGQWPAAGGGLAVLGLASLFFTTGPRALPRIALVSAGLVTAVLLAVLRPLAPAFDMTPMAGQLAMLEKQGVPVAHLGAYNDQYHFYGRLQRPLQEVARNRADDWFQANPAGRAVAYLKKPSQLAEVRPEFSQPYLDGVAVLLDAESARRMPGGGR